jgi:hypothetical protein
MGFFTVCTELEWGSLLYVPNLSIVQRKEGGIYTQSKCQCKSALEEGKRKVRELRSLLDTSFCVTYLIGMTLQCSH